MSQPTSAQVDLGFGRWERGLELVFEWVPYVTLVIGLALGLANAASSADRLVLIGLAGGAAVWTFVMFTRPGGINASQSRLRVYFLGFFAFGAVMMFLAPSFFVYLITGFIHTFAIKPPPLAFLVVGLNSLLINQGFISSTPSSDDWWTFGIVVAIQTTVVGFGVIGGGKMGELSEQRKRTVAELEAALTENAVLHAQLVGQAREAGTVEERQRMAREIHDTIAQGLIGVITQLEAAGQMKNEPLAMQRRLDNATKLARDSLAEARRSVQALVPASLEGRSLAAAIADVSEKWSRLNEVPTVVTTTGSAISLRPEVEVAVLRITQEALANIAKHASASRVGVTLSYMGDVVTIDVRDDGVGFTPNGATGGFGLSGMRQRVEALSGSLDVESASGEGTAISATLPAIPEGAIDG